MVFVDEKLQRPKTKFNSLLTIKATSFLRSLRNPHETVLYTTLEIINRLTSLSSSTSSRKDLCSEPHPLTSSLHKIFISQCRIQQVAILRTAKHPHPQRPFTTLIIITLAGSKSDIVVLRTSSARPPIKAIIPRRLVSIVPPFLRAIPPVPLYRPSWQRTIQTISSPT